MVSRRLIGPSLLVFASTIFAGMASSALASDYVQQDDFWGASFFDAFHVEAINDPTHGYVTYVSRATAIAEGLIGVDAAGRAHMTVDSTSIASGNGRKSVRLKSKKTYRKGLFVIDAHHMPEGNGVWPAFWTVGAPWPAQGEIDVIEGVNNQNFNNATLHTSAGCSMHGVDQAATMTGTYLERNCNAGNGNVGCGTKGHHGSFGPDFNHAGGGVFAMEWTDSAIKVWFFPRNAIPADLHHDATPKPDTWGKPVSYFALGSECHDSHFGQHTIVLNTTFCGDWAGNTFTGGMNACRDYVKNNPAAFANAYWSIASIRTYTKL